MNAHPKIEELRELFAPGLAGARRLELADHLAVCGECRHQTAGLAPAPSRDSAWRRELGFAAEFDGVQVRPKMTPFPQAVPMRRWSPVAAGIAAAVVLAFGLVQPGTRELTDGPYIVTRQGEILETADMNDVYCDPAKAALRARRILASGPASGGPPSAEEIALARRESLGSRVALGVFFARHGLWPEAEAEFAALAAQQPESELAAELLRAAQARR